MLRCGAGLISYIECTTASERDGVAPIFKVKGLKLRKRRHKILQPTSAPVALSGPSPAHSGPTLLAVLPTEARLAQAVGLPSI